MPNFQRDMLQPEHCLSWGAYKKRATGEPLTLTVFTLQKISKLEWQLQDQLLLELDRQLVVLARQQGQQVVEPDRQLVVLEHQWVVLVHQPELLGRQLDQQEAERGHRLVAEPELGRKQAMGSLALSVRNRSAHRSYS